MADDPFSLPPNDACNPYSSPAAENKPGNLPSLQTGLGSLGQEARLKNLNTARWILIVVGLMTIAAYAFQYTTIEKVLDEELAKELQKQGIARDQLDQAAFNDARASAINTARLLCIISIGLGVAYFLLGLLVKQYPVPMTITGLALYVGAGLVSLVLDPEYALRGIVIKVIIVVALVKSVQAALAYEKERKASEAMQFGL
jgi:hypothetical protein